MNLSRSCGQDELTKLSLGMDCAFLQDRDIEEKKSDLFCYFFGRSGYKDTGLLIDALRSKFQLQALDLSGWLRLNAKTAERDFAELRRRISSARFVLSDTYHVCINAINLGTTVICLGKEVKSQFGTLGDFKKRQLLVDLGLERFYLSASRIDKQTTQRVLELASNHLRDERDEVPEFSSIKGMVDIFRSKLTERLFR
jgi:hypothetical protein